MRAQDVLKHVFQTFLITTALASAAVLAQEADQLKAAQKQADKTQATEKQTAPEKKTTEEGEKSASVQGKGALGMSILGNYEAPKALVLVPWKASEPGKGPEVSTKVDDSRNPIDKEVFMRMLQYHQIAKTNAARPDTAATARGKQ